MSSTDGTNSIVGASMHARELSKRRVASNATTIVTPTTPATPIAPTTPMLAAHIFSDGNMMEDLQLAAELGKTLLERNKELEANIRDLRGVVDDKTQEIEYLSKQTAALREVNDSRLRIYEQLEVSIHDLEKSNQRLTAETAADKRKIRSLSGTVEGLESKCEELQRALDDARARRQKEPERGRPSARKSLLPEDSSMRRSQSCENSSQPYDDSTLEGCDLRARILNLEGKLKVALQEKESEVKKREGLEIEMACVAQENSGLQEQVLVFRAKETHFKSFDDEVASMDETASSKFCRKCLGTVEETGSNLTVQDLVDDLEEDLEPSFNDIQGECALVRLKNGGYAWGSQESLASMGQVVNYPGSSSTSPRTETSEAPHNSLLSELDAQYRILIEKYEALVEARERPECPPSKDDHHDAHVPRTLVDSGIDEVSGPMSLVMTEVPPGADQSSMNGTCQRCTSCSCDLKPGVPKNGNMEDLSEVETSSSGFSEGECRFCTKMTQTDPVRCCCGNDDLVITPTAFGSQLLDFNSSINPCDKRFVCQPDYRNLFHEIFEMLKKERQDIQVEKVVRRTLMQCKEFEARVNSTYNLGPTDDGSTIATTTASSCSNAPSSGANEENKSQTVATKQNRREKKERKSGGNTERKARGTESEPIVRDDNLKDLTKPSRPDFLDLETSSRGSSRSRRRKRSNRDRQNSGEPQLSEGQPAQMNNHRHDSCTKPEPNLPQQKTESRQSTTVVIPKDSPILRNSSSNLSGSYSKNTRQREPRSTSNSRKVRCEHKQKKNQHKHKPSLQNKHFSNVWVQHAPHQVPNSPTNNVWAKNHTGVTNSANLPSVQVAKLIKFEKSYAEVLKSKPHKDLRSS